MSENTKTILGALGGVVMAFSTVIGLNLADVETPVSKSPQAETPSVHANCPDGWADTSSEDEHMIVLSCQKDDWLVILHSDGTFSHGLQKNTPNAEFKFLPSEVPGWPR